MNKSHTLRWGMSLLALAALMACGEAPASSSTPAASSKEAESSASASSQAPVVSSEEQVTSEEEATTEEEVTSEEEATSEEEVDFVWFLSGTFNGWDKKNENYGLTPKDGIFVFEGLSLKAGAQFKVMGGTGEEAEWLPANNVTIPDTAKYDIAFDPAKGLIEEEGYTVIEGTVAYKNVGEYEGEVTEVEYYLSGALNEWASKDINHKLEKISEQKEGKDQYAILEVELPAGGLKVVDSDGKWYPDGMGTEYNVPAAGTYDVYFVPEGGISEWASFGGYFYVGAHAA